jgi:hypothetical protein
LSALPVEFQLSAFQISTFDLSALPVEFQLSAFPISAFVLACV